MLVGVVRNPVWSTITLLFPFTFTEDLHLICNVAQSQTAIGQADKRHLALYLTQTPYMFYSSLSWKNQYDI